MTSNDLASVAMWDSAVRDTDAEARAQAVTRATVALSGTWPFLAAAHDETDFEHRLALMSEPIAKATPPEVLDEVVAGLKAKFSTLHQARQASRAEAHEAARKVALPDGVSALPSAYVHLHKHGSGDDEYWQVDHVAGPSFLNTIAHVGDRDEALTKAREFGLPHGLPIFENGKHVEGNLHRQASGEEEILDAKTGSWVKVASLTKDAHQSWTSGGTGLHPAAGVADARAVARRAANWGDNLDPRQATNYQPDPDMQWRYRYQYGQVPAAGGGVTEPVPGPGAAQPVSQTSTDTDGFPKDVAQGENRSEEAYARMTTPGQWVVPPNANWPAEQRPNAATGLPEGARPGVTGSYYTRNKPEHYHHADGEQFYDLGYEHGHANRAPVYTGHEDYLVGHRDGQSDRQVEDVMGYPSSHHMSSRRTATEGIVPTPGPNPNYFSQGTQGLQGPAQYPADPAGDIEPKTNNHVDDIYGAVPPQVSSGSAQNQTDGQGYSRSAKLELVASRGGHAVFLHAPDESFQVGWWPQRTAAIAEGEKYLAAYRKQGEYKYVKRRGDKWVILQKGTGDVLSTHDSEDDAKASFRAMEMNMHSGSAGSPNFPWGAEERTAVRYQAYYEAEPRPGSVFHRASPTAVNEAFHVHEVAADSGYDSGFVPTNNGIHVHDYPQAINELQNNWQIHDDNLQDEWNPDRRRDSHRRREVGKLLQSLRSAHTAAREDHRGWGSAYWDLGALHARQGLPPQHLRKMDDWAHDAYLDGYLHGAPAPAELAATGSLDDDLGVELPAEQGAYGASPTGTARMRGHYDAMHGHEYAGELGRDTEEGRAYREGWDAFHNTHLGAVHVPDHEITVRNAQDAVEHLGDEHADEILGPGGLSGATKEQLRKLIQTSREYRLRESTRRQSSTDGRIVGKCDHCGEPVRYHTEDGGHLRHLHNDSPKCRDGRTATAMRTQWGPWEARFKLDPFVEKTAAVAPFGPGGSRREDFEEGYDHGLAGHGLTDHYAYPSRGYIEGHEQGSYDRDREREHDEMSDLDRQAEYQRWQQRQGAVLENPSAENPTGRGEDPYRAKTQWTGFEHQRPRQELEGEGGMNANTPTTAPEPIKVGPNINTPGPQLDQDGPAERDDSDEGDDDDDK